MGEAEEGIGEEEMEGAVVDVTERRADEQTDRGGVGGGKEFEGHSADAEYSRRGRPSAVSALWTKVCGGNCETAHPQMPKYEGEAKDATQKALMQMMLSQTRPFSLFRVTVIFI